MSDSKEIEQYIDEAVNYIKEKMVRDEEFERRSPREDEALSLRAETKSRLEDALKRAKALQKSLYPLVLQARDFPFLGMEKRINEAWTGATDAVVACTLALTESLPRAGNVRLKYRYHRAAVRLAVAIDDENARSIAEEIIKKAGLLDRMKKNDNGKEEPEKPHSEQAMSNWLKEARRSL